MGGVPFAALMNSSTGDFMTNQQLQEFLGQQEKWGLGQEIEWEARLSSMRQCICELLIKNQNLRELLESAMNRQRQEFADAFE